MSKRKSTTPSSTPAKKSKSTPCATTHDTLEMDNNDDSTGDGYVIGIDEAGRGPVLGSMVYGACWCPIKRKTELKNLGFQDSKKLTAEQRETLFTKIADTEWLSHAEDVITPQFLSARMLRHPRISLNTISHDSAIGLIQSLIDQNINVKQIFVDTVGDADRYREKLEGLFPSARVVVTSKADALFPIVSAASICAKVTRDHGLDMWKFDEKGITPTREFGSGYPGDPVTKQWLASNFHPIFGFPSIVRFSWQTTKTYCDENGKALTWGDEDEQEEEGDGSVKAKKKSRKLETFFAASRQHSDANIPLASRFQYFQQHHLQHVQTLGEE